MNRLSPENQADILEGMMERQSIRGLARTAHGNSKARRKGVSINTVLKLLEDAGDTAIQFLDARMRKLPCRYVEADEIYCIVKLNPKTLQRRKIKDPTVGAIWLWVAIDAESKLIVGWHVGGRYAKDASKFMKDLGKRFAGRVQLTTDSLAAYPEAVARAFDEIDYATVKKRSAEEERQRLKAEMEGKPYRPQFRRRPSDPPMDKEPPVHHLGEPDDSRATTNHIESLFTQVRKDLARMTRRGTTISKKIENLERAFALYVFHHNFVKAHTSLNGRTPAVAAGIDDSPWDWVEFITLIDEFWKTRRERKKVSPLRPPDLQPAPLPVPPPAEGPFCVYHALHHKTTKVHASTCTHLRTKPGREGLKGLGIKRYCETVDEALAVAEDLAPGHSSTCRVCLGSYNSKGYLGPK